MTTDLEPFVIRRDEGGVAHLKLNRPQQFNALSVGMLDALNEALDDIADDKSVRAVVFSGEGKVFCAGHDLKEMKTTYTPAFQQSLFRLCNRFMMRLINLPQPTIARVHNIATAAGCQLVSMCDLAVASEETRFAVSGIRYGLFCSTPAVGLSRNVGRKKAFEMLVTGDFIDATEAFRLGLINRVVPLDALDEEVAKLTAAICVKPPRVVAKGKALFYRQMEMGMDAAYQLAAETIADNAMMPEAEEGMNAFIEKRAPSWD